MADKVVPGGGANFLRVRRFPLPVLIPSHALYSSIIWDSYKRANIDRRTKCSQSHPTLQLKQLQAVRMWTGMDWSRASVLTLRMFSQNESFSHALEIFHTLQLEHSIKWHKTRWYFNVAWTVHWSGRFFGLAPKPHPSETCLILHHLKYNCSTDVHLQ
jgi:hypothetical protein